MEILIPVAPGTEEAEAVVTIDILRRANGNVLVAGLSSPIVCSRSVRLLPDCLMDDLPPDKLYDAVLVPGGTEGVKKLMESRKLQQILQHHSKESRLIGAICAGPIVLHVSKVLHPGQMLTSHPSVRAHLESSYVYLNQPVVIDKKIITSQGVGTAIDFALSCVALLWDHQVAEKIAQQICYQKLERFW